MLKITLATIPNITTFFWYMQERWVFLCDFTHFRHYILWFLHIFGTYAIIIPLAGMSKRKKVLKGGRCRCRIWFDGKEEREARDWRLAHGTNTPPDYIRRQWTKPYLRAITRSRKRTNTSGLTTRARNKEEGRNGRKKPVLLAFPY